VASPHFVQITSK